MAEVWAENRQSRLGIRPGNVSWFAERILAYLGQERVSLSVMVTDAPGIQRFNREFLGRDRPTNVISFPMKEGEAVAGDTTYLGDVVISVDAAEDEAGAFGYGSEETLLLYLIHGILHLSGYNHEEVSAEEAERMDEKQAEILRALNPFLKEHPLILAGKT